MFSLITAISVGITFGSAVYLLLSTQRRRWILGLMLITTTTNLILFLINRRNRIGAPFAGTTSATDPLPQALILTAIVIGLAVLAAAILATRKEDL